MPRDKTFEEGLRQQPCIDVIADNETGGFFIGELWVETVADFFEKI